MNVKPSDPLIRIGKKTKRISLHRFLISKIVYEGEQVRLAEWTCLYENQLWLERKCLKDRNFFNKFADDVFTLSHLMKECDLQGLLRPNKSRFSTRIRNTMQSFLIPKRNYSQWRARFSGRFSFNPQTLNREINEYYNSKQPPPKRSMGIGYRDKGSRRNLAKDGSPDWRDVASAQEPGLDYEKEIKDARVFSDIERVFVKTFPDENWGHYFAGKRPDVSAKDPEGTDGKETQG